MDSGDFAEIAASDVASRLSSDVALSSSVCAGAAKASVDEPAVASVGGDILRVLVALGAAAIAGTTGTIADEVFFSDVFSASD